MGELKGCEAISFFADYEERCHNVQVTSQVARSPRVLAPVAPVLMAGSRRSASIRGRPREQAPCWRESGPEAPVAPRGVLCGRAQKKTGLDSASRPILLPPKCYVLCLGIGAPSPSGEGTSRATCRSRSRGRLSYHCVVVTCLCPSCFGLPRYRRPCRAGPLPTCGGSHGRSNPAQDQQRQAAASRPCGDPLASGDWREPAEVAARRAAQREWAAPRRP
jgi:hypothetical protein